MSNAPDLVTSEAVKTIRSVAEEWRDGYGPHIDLMVLSRMAGIVQSACDVVSEADTRCEVTTNAPDLVSAAHDVLTVHPDLAECESMARLRSALAAHESREAERNEEIDTLRAKLKEAQAWMTERADPKTLRGIVDAIHDALGEHHGSDDSELPKIVGELMATIKEQEARITRLEEP